MKNFAKKLVLNFLLLLARIRLKRLRLFIIGVTGSIGKTSVKDAIYTILRGRYPVYRSEKSYNTEFGMPLAILGQPSGFSSALKWIFVLIGAMWNAFFGGRNMQMLVVEMGVDKPGDMLQLLKLVRPQVGVLININPVHLGEGQFRDLDDIFLEKKKLIESLPEKGVAILNADDPYVVSLRDSVHCKKIFYGFSEIADLRVLQTKTSTQGLEFTVSYRDELVSGRLPLLGGFQVYVILPALAVALSQGYTLEEAIAGLSAYKLPAGRMNPIEGINETLIIDSSYNASPEAVREALEVLKQSEGRRIAVLGNMNELGDYTDEKHREIGKYAAGRTDILFTVGDDARLISEEAKKHGFPARAVAHFQNANSAAEHIRQILQKGDTLLVKGSQNNVRLERLVKALMKHPEKSRELLTRQEPEWENVL